MQLSINMEVIESVKEYYGKTLETNKDLKTNACKTPCQKMQPQLLEALKNINETIIEKYYGCGLCIPDCLKNCHVLDLGCGAGRDCYIVSQLVGEEGHVTGLDMTEEQINVAKKFELEQAQKFGYSQPNTEFLMGYLEDLSKAGVKPGTIDVIVSNCVVNLCADKKKVLSEAYKVLKVGGELYFSDVYCDRPLSEEVRNHKQLWGEGLGGALYWKDLHLLSFEIGFSRPRLVTVSEFTVAEEFKPLIGDNKYVSATYRLFKLPEGSSVDGDSQTQVTYKGGIPHLDDTFTFDCQTTFKKGCVSCVDENLNQILKHSRFGQYFTINSSNKEKVNGSQSGSGEILDPFNWLKSN